MTTFKTLRGALAAAGGVQVLVAFAAVAWGLGRLQAIAQERRDEIAELDAYLAEWSTHLRAEAAARHPSARVAEEGPVPDFDTDLARHHPEEAEARA